MIVKALELENFRNYENLSLTFSEGTNILYGDNAQGKTNLLEAIYLSGTSRSHRGTKDRDMIRFSEEECHIRTVVGKEMHDETIDIHLRRSKGRGISINHLPIRKTADLMGVLNMIFSRQRT